MSAYLRVILGIVVIVYFLLILHFVKKKMLSLKYTLLWLFSGFAMGMLVLFPGLLDAVWAVCVCHILYSGHCDVVDCNCFQADGAD